ncbi:hypothetical protein IAD21_04679 [Abditibacteriota bacterium]|nr:hypothetical protein IAD21_04679 [Abditibacteriota bacterium]
MGKTRKTAPHLTNSDSSISTNALVYYTKDWLNDSRIRQHSQHTIGERECFIAKLIWFLRHKGCETCGLAELREFLVYLGEAHLEKGGRWGNPRMTKPLRPK